MSGRDFVREIPIEFPEKESRHDVLATLWARTRIDDLMSQDYNGIQSGNPRKVIREAITQLGLNFRLMTQFTSFVAVEEMTVTDGGAPRKIDVPVEMPEGVSHELVFGKDKSEARNSYNLSTQISRSMSATESVTVTAAEPKIQTKSSDNSVAVRAGQYPGWPAPPSASPSRARTKKQSGTGSGRGGGIGHGSGGGSGPGSGASSGGAKPSPGTATNGLTLAESVGPADRRSAEEQTRRDLLAKMSPSIAGVIERLKSNAQPTADEPKFVRNGKAEIQIWLTDKSSEVIAQLKQLGFEVVLDPKSAKMIIGRLPIEKLAALAELKSVRYIGPLTNN
jgi:hypothetical protein